MRLTKEFWMHLDRLVNETEIIIDRPKASTHPEHDDMIFPADYGYLAGTTSSDGAGIDIWQGRSGERRVVGIICTVDLLKRDSEIKVLLGCTDDEMRTIAQFLNQGDMRGLLVKRE